MIRPISEVSDLRLLFSLLLLRASICLLLLALVSCVSPTAPTRISLAQIRPPGHPIPLTPRLP